MISPRTSRELRDMHAAGGGARHRQGRRRQGLRGRRQDRHRRQAERLGRLCPRQDDLDLRRVLPRRARRSTCWWSILDEPTAIINKTVVPHRRPDRGAGARRTRSAGWRRSWACDPRARPTTARRCFTRSPETNSRMAEGAPGARGDHGRNGSHGQADGLRGAGAARPAPGARGDWSGALPEITGLSVDSRDDARRAISSPRCPGRRMHGAEFVPFALRMGAVAVLTDPDGPGASPRPSAGRWRCR